MRTQIQKKQIRVLMGNSDNHMNENIFNSIKSVAKNKNELKFFTSMSGEEILKIADKELIDIFVIVINNIVTLPYNSPNERLEKNLQLVSQIKKIYDSPVIVLCGFATDNSFLERAKMVADAFFLLPIQYDLFNAAVGNCFDVLNNSYRLPQKEGKGHLGSASHKAGDTHEGSDTKKNMAKAMNKNEVISRLEECLDRLKKMIVCDISAPAFKEWLADTENSLENCFDNNNLSINDHKNFTAIRFVPNNENIFISEQDRETAFIQGRGKAQIFIQSIINEVREYWDEPTQPTEQTQIKSKSVETPNNAARYSYHIALKDGRAISLIELHQYFTYSGLLLGYPDKKLNKKNMEQAKTKATRLFSLSDKDGIYLVEPLQRKKMQTSPRQKTYWELPFITCIGSFESSSRSNRTNGDYSFLTIIWYQDSYALPVEDIVLEQIKAIDWNRCATSCFF